MFTRAILRIMLVLSFLFLNGLSASAWAATLNLSANPATVASGGATTLSWSGTDLASCTASGGWSGVKAVSGSEIISGLTATTRFNLNCRANTGGSVRKSVRVSVTAAPPTVSLSASPASVSPGGSSTLSWSSTNATSCTASGAWSGSRAVTGSETLINLTVTGTYTLTCSGAGGSTEQSVTVSVIPSTNGEADAALLNFAETWAQNWNYGGHAVDAQFTADYGYWVMDEVTYEPWLFDRASVGYYLYQATGDSRWRDQFFTYFDFYRTHIDAQGIFTPKGYEDTKYSYVTPFLLYERESGDAQYRSIAQRIHDRWVAELPDNYSTTISLWTEREIGLALEAAVSYYELTLDSAALTRARALLNHWDQVCAGGRAPLHTLEQHGEEFDNEWSARLMTSPWMSGLYFQAAMRLHQLTGDTQPLTQLSRYADWLDQYAFVDAAVTHPEHAGYYIPYYLVGEDGPYTKETPDWGDADHAYDVGNMLEAAIYAKSMLGEDASAITTRRAQMNATALNNFEYWTRTTQYLPKYRLSPPRKFNWWYRSRTF